MAGKRKTNEAGSTNNLRADVLRVLGVLKAATADQIQRLSSPHLTYRHTLKKTPAYQGKMPIVATTLELLREHGPTGPAFWRFGREGPAEPLGRYRQPPPGRRPRPPRRRGAAPSRAGSRRT
ncbi:hypothetical protein ACIRP7_36390 [Streptomyces sp. NPDC102270]|uniref:hypothetical protein n=1 Tax=Streptomyces sp. NPDC102270 TaxID=3366150 RepID=UPI00381C7386